MTAREAEAHMAIVEMRAGIALEGSRLLLALGERYITFHQSRLDAPRLTPGLAADPTSAAGPSFFSSSSVSPPAGGGDFDLSKIDPRLKNDPDTRWA